MQQRADTNTAAVLPRAGDDLAPVGLSAKHPAVWKLLKGFFSDPEIAAAISVRIYALPFADWRCTGKDRGA